MEPLGSANQDLDFVVINEKKVKTREQKIEEISERIHETIKNCQQPETATLDHRKFTDASSSNGYFFDTLSNADNIEKGLVQLENITQKQKLSFTENGITLEDSNRGKSLDYWNRKKYNNLIHFFDYVEEHLLFNTLTKDVIYAKTAQLLKIKGKLELLSSSNEYEVSDPVKAAQILTTMRKIDEIIEMIASRKDVDLEGFYSSVRAASEKDNSFPAVNFVAVVADEIERTHFSPSSENDDLFNNVIFHYNKVKELGVVGGAEKYYLAELLLQLSSNERNLDEIAKKIESEENLLKKLLPNAANPLTRANIETQKKAIENLETKLEEQAKAREGLLLIAGQLFSDLHDKVEHVDETVQKQMKEGLMTNDVYSPIFKIATILTGEPITSKELVLVKSGEGSEVTKFVPAKNKHLERFKAIGAGILGFAAVTAGAVTLNPAVIGAGITLFIASGRQSVVAFINEHPDSKLAEDAAKLEKSAKDALSYVGIKSVDDATGKILAASSQIQGKPIPEESTGPTIVELDPNSPEALGAPEGRLAIEAKPEGQ